MPEITLHQLPEGPLLALDPGSKTIGVAACGASRGMAAAVETIQRVKFTPDAKRVFTLYDERKAEALIIGLPLNMDGSEGPRAQSSRALGRNLMGLRDIPIFFQDERLSTFDAQEALLAAGVKHKNLKSTIDAHAAANILQSVLNGLETMKP
jgi:putative Holliday junction resolvase